MIVRFFLFGLIALIGIFCFITAAIFVTKGHNAEWITLCLAPISGICVAIVMHFSNIDLKIKLHLVVKNGHLSFKVVR